MVRITTHGFTLPKTVAIVAGLGVAIGLAVAAPVRAASPSTAASRIVGHHKKDDGGRARHRTLRERDSRR
ncbi:MAG: hypothetical protein ACRDP6_30905 [Actinoallomurus sp.]